MAYQTYIIHLLSVLRKGVHWPEIRNVHIKNKDEKSLPSWDTSAGPSFLQ